MKSNNNEIMQLNKSLRFSTICFSILLLFSIFLSYCGAHNNKTIFFYGAIIFVILVISYLCFEMYQIRAFSQLTNEKQNKNIEESITVLKNDNGPIVSDTLSQYLSAILLFAQSLGYTPLLQNRADENNVMRLYLVQQIAKDIDLKEFEYKTICEVAIFDGIEKDSSEYKAVLERMKEKIQAYRDEYGV